jgi:hypothetical protein
MAISLKLAAPPGDDEILDPSKRNPDNILSNAAD